MGARGSIPFFILTSFSNVLDGFLKLLKKRNRGVFNDKVEHKYAFDLLLQPQPLKNYKVPNTEELINEAVILVIADTDTNIYTATFATYYILTHSDVLRRLQEELPRTLSENGGRLEWANVRQLPISGELFIFHAVRP